MRIRPFEPRDIGPVTSLVRTELARLDRGADFGGLGIDVRDVGVGERAGTWVCEVGGEVAAVMVVQPGEGEACVLKRLYVAPAHRHQGVGRALVEQAARWAPGASYRSLELHVPDGLTELPLFLERCGFRRTSAVRWNRAIGRAESC